MARREEEIMEAVRKREAEVCEAWVTREKEIRKEFEDNVKVVEERVDWVQAKEEELKVEEARLEAWQAEIDEKIANWEDSLAKGRKEKMPLEEIKNIATRHPDDVPHQQRRKNDIPTPRPSRKAFPSLSTPISRTTKLESMPSAMKGVVLTSTGEILTTPTPAELVNLFQNSPRVGLNFTKIFDFEDGNDDYELGKRAPSTPATDAEASPPPSPSTRKEKQSVRTKSRRRAASSDTGSTAPSPTISTSSISTAPPTRLRRPSIRSKAPMKRSTTLATLPTSSSDPSSLSSGSASASTSQIVPKPLPPPHLANTTTRTLAAPRPQPIAEYDLADEENLPSPFLKRNLDRAPPIRAPVQSVRKRPSSGHALRAVAAANAAGKRISASSSSEDVPAESPGILTRPVVASARKASEEARKTLSR
ncbi:hypothetical protein H0H87_001511 [Tephrocybe sp. NHM501043]|nr:hypothetical protein H0H87_001511 [Tephrocybe sp. NHM501043]